MRGECVCGRNNVNETDTEQDTLHMRVKKQIPPISQNNSVNYCIVFKDNKHIV